MADWGALCVGIDDDDVDTAISVKRGFLLQKARR